MAAAARDFKASSSANAAAYARGPPSARFRRVESGRSCIL